MQNILVYIALGLAIAFLIRKYFFLTKKGVAILIVIVN